MTLAAGQVVALVAGIISTAVPAMEDRTDKPWPVDKAGLSAFAVSSEDEESAGTTIHAPSVETHDLTVRISVKVAAVEALNAAMDVAAAAVLTAVNSTSAAADIRAAGIKVWAWVRTSRDRKTTGEADIGRVDMDYLARFSVRADAPETILGATP